MALGPGSLRFSPELSEAFPTSGNPGSNEWPTLRTRNIPGPTGSRASARRGATRAARPGPHPSIPCGTRRATPGPHGGSARATPGSRRGGTRATPGSHGEAPERRQAGNGPDDAHSTGTRPPTPAPPGPSTGAAGHTDTRPADFQTTQPPCPGAAHTRPRPHGEGPAGVSPPAHARGLSPLGPPGRADRRPRRPPLRRGADDQFGRYHLLDRMVGLDTLDRVDEQLYDSRTDATRLQ